MAPAGNGTRLANKSTNNDPVDGVRSTIVSLIQIQIWLRCYFFLIHVSAARWLSVVMQKNAAVITFESALIMVTSWLMSFCILLALCEWSQSPVDSPCKGSVMQSFSVSLLLAEWAVEQTVDFPMIQHAMMLI